MAPLANESIESVLKQQFRGQPIEFADAGYEDASKVYNATCDRRWALIARCADVADVVAPVNFARDTELRLAVRCGAHNRPEFGTGDGVLTFPTNYRIPPHSHAVLDGDCLPIVTKLY